MDEPEWEARGQTPGSLSRQRIWRSSWFLLAHPPALLEEAEVSRYICIRNKAASSRWRGEGCPRKRVVS